MKTLSPVLLLLVMGWLVACTPGQSTGLDGPEAAPRATVAMPVPTETAIKPLQSQPAEQPIAADAPVVAYNEIKEGQLDSPQAIDEWVLQAKAGERVTIVLNSRFDSYLELFAPDGEFIASSDDTGNNLNAALFELQLTKSGPHKIVVRGFNGATGSYALAVTGGHPTAGAGPLTDGASRKVMLSQRGVKWQYQGKANTYLTAGVQAEDLVDPRLALYGPDGTLLTSDDDSGSSLNPEIFEFELPVDGTYTLHAQTNAKTGMVTLNINSSSRTTGGGPLAMGSTQTGTLKPDRSHLWSFEGQAGQIINLTMTSTDFDPFLEVRDSRGAILAENDDFQGSNNSAINLLTLPADDSYTVIARGVTQQDRGDYQITLKTVKVTPGGGPLANDAPTQALLTPGQTDRWTFEAEANSYITVNLKSTQLDTYLELYSPEGDLLLEDDDSGGGLNAALLDFLVPQAGQYQLVVKSAREGATNGGVYEILLTVTKNLDTTGRLTAGQLEGTRLTSGDQHTWTFEAEADSYATVRMESEAVDTYLALYDSSGELLALNDDFLGTNAVIANFIVPETGDYRLVARAYSTEAEGDYTILLEISEAELPLSPTTNQDGG